MNTEYAEYVFAMISMRRGATHKSEAVEIQTTKYMLCKPHEKSKKTQIYLQCIQVMISDLPPTTRFHIGRDV